MKGFKLGRRVSSSFAEKLKAVDEELGATIAENIQSGLPAIDLTAQAPLMTAFMNDCDPQLVFAQQVGGYGKPGDVLLGISTSGNSKNVLYAAVVAKACGLLVIGLTGEKESKMMNYADVCIRVPETEKKKTWKRKVPKRFGLNRMPYHPDKRTKTFTHTIETDWVKNLKNTDIGVWRDSSCVGRPSDKKPVCTSTTKNIAVQRNNSILESRSFI